MLTFGKAREHAEAIRQMGAMAIEESRLAGLPACDAGHAHSSNRSLVPCGPAGAISGSGLRAAPPPSRKRLTMG